MKLTESLGLSLGRKLPVVLQTEVAECGLACLAMIAHFHGHRTTLTEMRQRFSVSLKGMGLRQLMGISRQLGLGARAVQLELHELGGLALPCILHWRLDHFVVLKSVSGKSATIHDPASGVRRIPMEEVSRCFTGVALEMWPSPGFQEKKSPPRLKLMSLMGRISGLRRSLAQAVLLAFAIQVLALISPFLMQWTIDNVIPSEDRSLLNTLLIGFSLLLIFQLALGAARAWVMMHMSTMFGIQWSTNLFSHMLRLPVSFFEKRSIGDVVSRFGASEAIQKTLTSSFLSAVLDGIMALATLALMYVYSPLLATIAVLATIVYAILRWIWYAPLRNATEEQIVHSARQQTHFLETIRAVRAIKLFQRLEERRAAWLGLVVEQTNAGLRTQKLQILYQQVDALLSGVEHLLVIGIGATMVMEGQFTVGMLMAFYSYKSSFDGHVNTLVDHFFELRMLQLQNERLADIALHPPEDDKPDVVPPPEAGCADITVRGLRYRYADQEPWILDDVDLTIREGEFVAIVGPSGCGKTTLLKVLLGILPASRGQILLAGQEVSRMGVTAFQRHIGTVMQDDVLMAGSLAENISFFDSRCDMAWVVECARAAAIHDEIEAMPMGYSTLVGDMGSSLSGGQKLRVMLARALYKRPRILVLDEATSHLDVESERRVNQSIQALGVTRIIVAHRPETIAWADRVIVLEAGRIAADNPGRRESGPA